jgi:hypothetical protein
VQNHRQKTNWLIELFLFAGFVLTYVMDLTGLSLHQWLGLGVGALAFVHLARHADWVVAVTSRLFQKTSPQARVYYLLDLGVLMGLVSIIASGVVMSTWLHLNLAHYELWKVAHVLLSAVTLLVVVPKLALHWRWIASVARRVVSPGSRPAVVAPSSAQPVAQRSAAAPGGGRLTTTAAKPVTRRDFLKVMGVVGAAATAASIGAMDGLLASVKSSTTTAETGALAMAQAAATATPIAAAAAQATAKATVTPTGQATSVATKVATATPQTSTSCVVRCDKGCSYPGLCRRYVDSNRNGKCDNGECM